MSSSLADKLLDDLGSSSDEDGDDNNTKPTEGEDEEEQEQAQEETVDDGEDVIELRSMDYEMASERTETSNSLKSKKEWDDKYFSSYYEKYIPLKMNISLKNLTDKILKSSLSSQQEITKKEEEQEQEQDYMNIMKSASLINEMDDLIDDKLFEQMKVLYSPVFPELDTLISTPLEYANIIKLTCDNNKLTSNNLKPILPSELVITISVISITSMKIKLLSDSLKRELQILIECIFHLYKTRNILLKYIQQHIKKISPNLVCIVDGIVAAQLISAVGGLIHLSNLPSNNILVLGKSQSQSQSHKQIKDKHNGFLYQCPLILSLPMNMRRKGCRIMSGKITLAIRVDAYKLRNKNKTCNDANNDEIGLKLRLELEKKFEKLQTRPPAKKLNPLSIPGEEMKRKHRGGSRARKEKERYGLTEAWKLKNRLKFGVEEEDKEGLNDFESDGLGMLSSKKNAMNTDSNGSNKLKLKKSSGIVLAGKRKLEQQKKKENISEAEKLGITSNILFNNINNNNNNINNSNNQNENENTKTKTIAKSNHNNYFDVSTPFLGINKSNHPISKMKQK